MKNLSETNVLLKIRNVMAFAITLAIGVTLGGCKKETTGEEVSVEIQSPADAAVYQSGDTVQLKVYARDNKDLHEMSLEIRDGSNIMLGMYPYVHALVSYTIDTTIIMPAVVSSQQLSVVAKARDHESHSSSQTFSITLNP